MRVSFWLGPTVFGVLLLGFFHIFRNSTTIPAGLNLTYSTYLTRAIGDKIVSCILETSAEFLEDKFVDTITKCVRENSEISKQSFTSLEMGRFNEKKRFLIPKFFNESTENEKCIWLTIGIGGDTAVEEKFKAKFPMCKIFGIEAFPGAAKDFDKYGQVIPYAIGLEEGKLPMRLLVAKNKYVIRMVDIHPLHEVLDEYLNTRVISFGTLDIEGFEYEILNGFKEPDGVFAKAGVRFCQIDVELHNPDWKGKDFSFGNFFVDFMQKTRYVPVHAEKFNIQHLKVTLIDGSGSYSDCDNFRFDLLMN